MNDVKKKSLNNRIKSSIYYLINSCVYKINRVIIWEPWNIETNTIEVANYISSEHKIAVFYILPKKLKPYAKKILSNKIKLISQESIVSRLLFLTSKYIFTAHWSFPRFYTEKQVVINIWHGIPYKRICRMSGKNGVPADITVATSELTKKMFFEAFGVSYESIFVSGYPRNDILVRTYKDKVLWKNKIKGNLSQFDKILIWLPTRRTDITGHHPTDGTSIDNAFQIEGFDSQLFNEMLKKHNSLCFVKPHPLSVRTTEENLSNVLMIDDEWLWNQGITLYHLCACTDILISDVSSIITDYLLIDQPIICFSTDFDEYKRTRGFYFEDIEEWLPSLLIKNQKDFFDYLDRLLLGTEDGYQQKRKDLKDAFFTNQDSSSTKRLIDHAFSFNDIID